MIHKHKLQVVSLNMANSGLVNTEKREEAIGIIIFVQKL